MIDEFLKYAPICISLGALGFSYFNFQHNRKTLKLVNESNNLRTGLDLEKEVRGLFQYYTSTLEKLNSELINNNKNKLSKQHIENLQSTHDAALSNWLNAMDRLCYFILEDKIPDQYYRSEWRNTLDDTVEKNPTWFTASTRFTNILDLRKRWK